MLASLLLTAALQRQTYLLLPEAGRCGGTLTGRVMVLERCRWVRVDSPRSIELNGQRITTRADGSFDWTPTDRQGLIPIAVGSGTLAFPSLAALNCEGSAPTQIQKISETGCANDLIRVIGTGLNRIQKILLDANAPLTFEFGSSLAGYWRLPENAAPGGHTLKLIL